MKTGRPCVVEAAIALAQMDAVEIEQVGATTGVKLALDRARSNKHFHVFRGCSGANSAIAEVECRTARVNAASRAALIYLAINEGSAPTGTEVISRLGKPHSIQVPPVQPQTTGSAIYIYQVSGGEVRFAVKTGAPDAVLSIAIDRTALGRPASITSRLAQWGNADLTPVSS